MAPRALIIAGPNGAGKTTWAMQYLPRSGPRPVYLNADLIAAGLSPFAPERVAVQAARLMAQAIADAATAREDFTVETTLAARSYLGLIREWRAAGYAVGLVFLRLPSVEIALERVRQRVRQGGHHIPDDVVRRRFDLGWQNFEQAYRSLVDDWQVYDANVFPPLLIASGGAS
jgi:predicted ABC-type ATPase